MTTNKNSSGSNHPPILKDRNQVVFAYLTSLIRKEIQVKVLFLRMKTNRDSKLMTGLTILGHSY